MSQTNPKRRLAAILCADAVGYSGRMEKDETGTLFVLNALRESVLNPTIADHNGRIFKAVGDGFLVEFSSVVEAVECALDIQRNLQKQNKIQEREQQLEFRIGVNLGDVIVQDDDIFGDGVNLAARLETVAKPGGVALSDAAFRQVVGKVVAMFEDAGLQTLKNIAEPVQVFHWSCNKMENNSRDIQAGNGLPPSAEPTIIVLPFANSSGNPQYDMFADGVAEDVIYGVSKYSGFEVIGRFSAFSDKTRRMTMQELHSEIGVRYIVSGDVRRGKDRVRVSIELTDCMTGVQLWNNRFDRELSDVFQIEDEISEEIVAALPGQILRAEKDRVRRKPPRDMTAYDHVIAGRLLHHNVLPDDNREAIIHLEKAIQLDPDYADAYAWKACTLGQSLQFGFASEPKTVESEAIAMIEKALALDEEHLECHRLLSEVNIMFGQLDQAAQHNKRALTQNSCDPRLLAQKGEVLTWQGNAKDGVEWIEQAMKLDPFGAPGRAHLLGKALYTNGQYDDAVRAYAMIATPNHQNLAETAASLARNGNLDEAKELTIEVLRQIPEFSAIAYASKLYFALSTDEHHLRDGLIIAGLPK